MKFIIMVCCSLGIIFSSQARNMTGEEIEQWRLRDAQEVWIEMQPLGASRPPVDLRAATNNLAVEANPNRDIEADYEMSEEELEELVDQGCPMPLALLSEGFSSGAQAIKDMVNDPTIRNYVRQLLEFNHPKKD